MDDHKDDCKCIACEMKRGYIAMAEIELEVADTYRSVEDEAYKLAIGA